MGIRFGEMERKQTTVATPRTKTISRGRRRQQKKHSKKVTAVQVDNRCNGIRANMGMVWGAASHLGHVVRDQVDACWRCDFQIVLDKLNCATAQHAEVVCAISHFPHEMSSCIPAQSLVAKRGKALGPRQRVSERPGLFVPSSEMKMTQIE